jgi:hypothetical protein
VSNFNFSKKINNLKDMRKIFILSLVFVSIFKIDAQFYVVEDPDYTSQTLVQSFSNKNVINYSRDGSIYNFADAGTNSSGYISQLIKYLPNGKIDSNFGTDGQLILPGASNLRKGIMFSNNFMYLEDFGPASYGATSKRLRKFNLNGELQNFNQFQCYNLFDDLRGFAVNLQNEEIYLAYKFFSEVRVVKLQSDGYQDMTFGTKTFAYIRNLLVTTEGKLILLLEDRVLSFNSDGSANVAFADQGVLLGNFQQIYLNKTNDLFFLEGKTVKKYQSSGVVDSAFGSNGIMTINLPGVITSTLKIEFDSNNKINVLAENNSNVLLARYNEDGSEDLSFNNNSYFLVAKKKLFANSDGYRGVFINDSFYLMLRQYVSVASDNLYTTRYIRTDSPLATTDISLGKLQIYPNPIKDYFRIKIKEGEKILQVRIFDTSGRMILQTGLSGIDTTKLNQGIYFLEVKTNKSIYAEKLIKY